MSLCGNGLIYHLTHDFRSSNFSSGRMSQTCVCLGFVWPYKDSIWKSNKTVRCIMILDGRDRNLIYWYTNYRNVTESRTPINGM